MCKKFKAFLAALYSFRADQGLRRRKANGEEGTARSIQKPVRKELDVSVVIPVKDEQENIMALADELTRVLGEQSWSWECVWVNDGSSDGSQSVLEKLNESDCRHRYITFQRNSGQSAAFWVGFAEARGRILATIDGDGQNDPSDIPALVELILTGTVDMANGYRAQRRDSLIRKLASKIANSFRNAVTGNVVRDVGCSTRAFRSECVAQLPQFAGMHRFLPTLVAMHGFKLGEFPVNHRPRMGGKSKYTINNRLWVGLIDTLGILWLRKRNFNFEVAKRSKNGKAMVAGE